MVRLLSHLSHGDRDNRGCYPYLLLDFEYHLVSSIRRIEVK